MIIGITGSSGSGKSMAASILTELGFMHIDFDAVAKNVAVANSPCLNEIIEEFGKGILNSDNTLNRRALGEIVFNDSAGLKVLNAITHKYILAEADKIIAASDGDIIIDAPLLFEAELQNKCDFTIGIIADRETQIKRICARDNISEETAAARLDKQHDNDFFIKNCTYTVENTGDGALLKERLAAIYGERCK